MKKNAQGARSVTDLIDLIQQGVRPKYVFFWGHTPKVPGQADQSCLSNWFPAAFNVDGVKYATTEHYMMAEKARLFGDSSTLEQILLSKSPGEVKKLGRQVSGFDDKIWNSHRFRIVVAGNFAKFSQNEEFGGLLVKTGSKVLVEAAPRDRIWGIGMGRNNEQAEDPSQWRGFNLLGFALMDVRQQLSKRHIED